MAVRQQVNIPQAAVVTLVLATYLSAAAFAETRKEYRFTVGPKANVSVDTQYGSISVKPGTSDQVVVTAILKSASVDEVAEAAAVSTSGPK